MRLGSAKWILIVYSLVLTALLVGIFAVFSFNIALPGGEMPEYFFALDENAVAQSLTITTERSNVLHSSASLFIGRSKLDDYYLTGLKSNIPYLVGGLVLMLVGGTFALSRLLSVQHDRQSRILAKQLMNVGESGDLVDQHPAIAEAYEKIRERMEVNARDYMRLSAYVTHEQKNILSLLRAKLQLGGHEELTADVDRVTESLDDILTLSSGGDMGNREFVDVALVCADVCDEYRRLHANIEFDFEEEAGTIILAREIWIRRAVSNLIGNALKYAGEGVIGVYVTGKNGSVIVSVSDEGPGLSDAERETLFSYQVRVGRLKKDGYGIGLSLVRHVCGLCGGVCWADGREGGGMTFYVAFPQGGEPSEQSLNDPYDMMHGRKGK